MGRSNQIPRARIAAIGFGAQARIRASRSSGMGIRALVAACAALLLAAAPAFGDDADVRARALVAKMTQDEKFQLMSGACDPHGHTGFVPGIPRLGIPDLYLNDRPVGVHEEP